MTDEYKKNLIDYVTDRLNQTQKEVTDFDITNITEYDYTSDVWTPYVSEFNNYYATVNGILQNEKYDKFIMYGGFISKTQSSSKGFLIYLDRNGIPYKLIKTNYRGILHLEFDEENNRVYGVEGDKSTYQSSQSQTVNDYFVYYNNLFLTDNDDYKLQQTYSYKIHDTQFGVDSIIKDPSSATYLIIGRYYVQPVRPIVINLKINVGSSNEITKWQPTTSSRQYFLNGAYGWFDSGTPHFKLICWYVQGGNFVSIVDNGTSYTITNITIDVSPTYGLIGTFVHPQFISINKDSIYFICLEDTKIGNQAAERMNLYYYNGSSISTIYNTRTVLKYNPNGLPMINILNDTDNTLYLFEYINDEVANTLQVNLCNLTNNPTANKWETIGTYASVFQSNILNQRVVLQRNYNIVNLYTFSGYFTTGLGGIGTDVNGLSLNIQNLAPINGYVGNEYISVDSFKPEYVNLYANNELIFSRNLYNVSIQNNMTMSSVEIPNNYLNDTEVDENNLISETKLTMNNDTTHWTKNIYEVVDLNFLNTISVIDEDTNTPYLPSAIKINNSITNGGDTNYQNTPCNKYRLNYSDETNAIKSLYWSYIDDYNKETTITFYTDKEVISIDLLSNDETTTYLTIPIETEQGKYYRINQKVRVGDKVTLTSLNYNNQGILYNNEPIMVYAKEV